VGKASDEDHVRRYVDAVSNAAKLGDVEFQNWFCKTQSLEQTSVRGHWDFSIHILTRKVCELLVTPENKIALEIGYGGGRILKAAASFFHKAVGVDIHQESARARAFIDKPNVELVTGNGRNIPYQSDCVDFVYSFIVFLHLQSLSAFIDYVKESHRVLRNGGVANLYYGRHKDTNDYLEFASDANSASLSIGDVLVYTICRDAGFSVIDTGTSYKNVPDGFNKTMGQQNFITLVKTA
jgi:ubiquinone/menaquinone biosynthesis C-methylase UbiE